MVKKLENLELSSEMLGSSRREKGVKIYREFDWWNFYSNVNCLGWNSYS